MELTINIKDQKNMAAFLNMIRKYDYVEIVDVKEDCSNYLVEHIKLLDERLKRVEEGKTTFKNWDLVKKRYEEKAV